jgi:predicted metal-dependent phosphoesterase TrpH
MEAKLVTQCVDLHIHTTASDGTETPTEVINKAKSIGLVGMAITDHDTVSGVEEGFIAGSSLGIDVVPGVEISCLWHEHSVHLLGYYFDIKNQSLTKLLEWMRKGREERLPKMIARLHKLGIEIDQKEVEAEAHGESTGRPHLAQVMIRHGYVTSFDEAFEKYLAHGRPAYAERPRPTIAEGIRVILEAGGLPVIAHPFTINAPIDQLISELCLLKIQGVEYYYPYEFVSGKSEEWYSSIPSKLDRLKQLAEKNNLVLTGGSDYHGSSHDKADLGISQVPVQVLHSLRKKYKELFRKAPQTIQ